MDKITVNITKEIEKAQSELDDCIESLSVLDNAVECGFLFDKHSLEMQKWIKEYKLRIEELRIFIENARTNG
jgi:cob(I)alamin adenosyltransferase